MDPEELMPSKRPAVEIGGDLSQLSIDELRARIDLLKEEIKRVEADIAAKSSSRAAADSFFKS
jgi:uncharacterized small protein (DUF1192 family)